MKSKMFVIFSIQFMDTFWCILSVLLIGTPLWSVISLKGLYKKLLPHIKKLIKWYEEGMSVQLNTSQIMINIFWSKISTKLNDVKYIFE